MSSVTGLASSSITSMIPGLCAAGQMKLVGATCATAVTVSSVAVNPANITIPALTGSQIAIIYLELYGGNENLSQTWPSNYRASASASGTGVNLNVGLAGTASSRVDAASSIAISASTLSKNSAFCTTTTGSQTITFSGFLYGAAGTASSGTIQAAVFIYTPPF